MSKDDLGNLQFARTHQRKYATSQPNILRAANMETGSLDPKRYFFGSFFEMFPLSKFHSEPTQLAHYFKDFDNISFRRQPLDPISYGDLGRADGYKDGGQRLGNFEMVNWNFVIVKDMNVPNVADQFPVLREIAKDLWYEWFILVLTILRIYSTEFWRCQNFGSRNPSKCGAFI